jgi:Na+/H+ antiporter NhaD/arsenite permease-like protein
VPAQATAALVIFLVTYAAIVTERPHRTLAALAGAGLMIFFRILSQEEATRAIDFNTIGLLVGMMVIVGALRTTGIFDWLGAAVVRASGGSLRLMLVGFFLTTALASALLDNVTTVLFISPMAMVTASGLNMSPMPLLLTVILASNIGGTATLIGDPPNIMIGGAVGLDFLAFLFHLAPLVLLLCAVVPPVLLVWWRKDLARAGNRSQALEVVLAMRPELDMKHLRPALVVFGLVVLGFLLHGALRIEAATIALAGATLLLIVTRADLHETFGYVEWSTIFFFVGLFVVVGGVEKVGWLDRFARLVAETTGGSMALMCLALLWASALLSAIVDNIPAVAALIPVLKAVASQTHPGVSHAWAQPDFLPVWWALALGACLGGNATLVGASANVVTAGLAERAGSRISFGRYLKVGAPVTALTLLLSTLYVWLRYLL